MRSLVRASLLIVVVATLRAGPATAQQPDLDPYTSSEDIVARLERGELVGREDVRFDGVFGAEAVEDAESDLVMFLVEATDEDAWSVFTGYEQQPAFMPHMARARVFEAAGEGGEARVCFDYEVLWVESTNCFDVAGDRETGTLVGRLDAERSDDRLHGVNYFWHMRPWRDGRLLLAYYQALNYSGAFAAFGHEMLVGPRSTAEAVRDEVRRVAAASE